MFFHSATLLASLALVKFSTAGYVLEDDYSPENFFNMFTFFTDTDPTNGFVKFVDQGTASSSGLINTTSSSVYMGVDSTNVTPNGRPSVRLTSTKQYNSGLIILDLAHMPGGVCGTWPAFWTVGADWPNNGEIDIIEGVNDQTANDMTLHTGAGCTITSGGATSNAAAFSGSITTTNCDVNAEGQDQNAGCQITTKDTSTFGNGFNSANGGVYATEWTSSGISVYHFSRDSIPADITSGSPNPSSWGLPMAKFAGGCDITNTFKNNQIVFDTTFCGDWAGNSWSSSSCASKASTCNAYVQNNPSDFAEAYWSINSLKVYQNNGAASNSTNTSASAGPTASKQSSTLAISTVPAVSTATVSVYMPSVSTPAASTPAVSTPAAASVTALQWGEFGQGSHGYPPRHQHRRAQHLAEHRRRQIREQW